MEIKNNSLENIKTKALENKIPILMDETLEVIKEVLIKNTPKSILEIGSGVGYSAICFSKLLKNKVNIDTIELNNLRAQEAIGNFEDMNLCDNINIIQGDAVEILPKINKIYDLIFIDASKGKYPIFLENSLRLTKKGSIIIADNILFKGYVLGNYNKHKQRTAVRNLREYLNSVTTAKNLKTDILDVGDGLSISYVI